MFADDEEEPNEKPDDTTDSIPTTEIELKPKSPVKKRRKTEKINTGIKKAFGCIFWKSAKTYDVAAKEGDNKSNVVELDDEKPKKAAEENGHVTTVDLDENNSEPTDEEKIEKENLETEKSKDTEDEPVKLKDTEDEISKSKEINEVTQDDKKSDEKTDSNVLAEDNTLEVKTSLDLLDQVIECQ